MVTNKGRLSVRLFDLYKKEVKDFESKQKLAESLRIQPRAVKGLIDTNALYLRIYYKRYYWEHIEEGVTNSTLEAIRAAAVEKNLFSPNTRLDIKDYDFDEEFKGVSGGRYYVTKCGVVYDSEDNKFVSCTSIDNKVEYASIQLYNKTYKLHRLVATLWNERPKAEVCPLGGLSPTTPDIVDHKDEDKTNYHSDNLRWVTSSGNNTGRTVDKESKFIILDLSDMSSHHCDTVVDGVRCVRTLDAVALCSTSTIRAFLNKPPEKRSVYKERLYFYNEGEELPSVPELVIRHLSITGQKSISLMNSETHTEIKRGKSMDMDAPRQLVGKLARIAGYLTKFQSNYYIYSMILDLELREDPVMLTWMKSHIDKSQTFLKSTL